MTSITSHPRILVIAVLIAIAALALSLSLTNLSGDSPAHAATHASTHSGAVNMNDGSQAAATDELSRATAEYQCAADAGLTVTEWPQQVGPGLVTMPVVTSAYLPGETPSQAAARMQAISMQCYLQSHGG